MNRKRREFDSLDWFFAFHDLLVVISRTNPEVFDDFKRQLKRREEIYQETLKTLLGGGKPNGQKELP